MHKFSLKYQLVLPFVLLMLLVPVGIGWMLYDSGATTVNVLTRRVLLDVVEQINTSTEQHLDTALNTLLSFAPESTPSTASPSFSSDMTALEKRAWTTNRMLSLSNNYVYFGGEDGRFIGLYRVNSYLHELYLRQPGAKKRNVYALNHNGGRAALLRTDDYDPRVRPWYVGAVAQSQPVWSPVYNDFTSKLPTITVAKRIYDSDKKISGVAAVDIELQTLADRFGKLTISQHGVAYVMDNSGYIVASSGGELPIVIRNNIAVPLHAGEMKSDLIRETYAKILEWKNNRQAQDEPLSLEQETDNGTLNVAASLVGHKQGVDWVTVVVAPRSDFMSSVTSSFNKSLIIAGFFFFAAMLIGMAILNRVLSDIYALNNAARKIGRGELSAPLHIHRKDELGQLARTFHEMEHNLRTDKLTGIYNREFLFNKVRLIHQQDSGLATPLQRFALLFIDLDNFKSINDLYGHDAGDQVLIQIASRLTDATRANDTVVRYGGDEFVVLLTDMSTEEAVMATEEKIRSLVESPIMLNQGEVKVGISIGWALFPEDGSNAEKLLKIADSRMFDAKKIRKSSR